MKNLLLLILVLLVDVSKADDYLANCLLKDIPGLSSDSVEEIENELNEEVDELLVVDLELGNQEGVINLRDRLKDNLIGTDREYCLNLFDSQKKALRYLSDYVECRIADFEEGKKTEFCQSFEIFMATKQEADAGVLQWLNVIKTEVKSLELDKRISIRMKVMSDLANTFDNNVNPDDPLKMSTDQSITNSFKSQVNINENDEIISIKEWLLQNWLSFWGWVLYIVNFFKNIFG